MQESGGGGLVYQCRLSFSLCLCIHTSHVSQIPKCACIFVSLCARPEIEWTEAVCLQRASAHLMCVCVCVLCSSWMSDRNKMLSEPLLVFKSELMLIESRSGLSAAAGVRLAVSDMICWEQPKYGGNQQIWASNRQKSTCQLDKGSMSAMELKQEEALFYLVAVPR